MSRNIGADGMAEEEYNFSSEVALKTQVKTFFDITIFTMKSIYYNIELHLARKIQAKKTSILQQSPHC